MQGGRRKLDQARDGVTGEGPNYLVLEVGLGIRQDLVVIGKVAAVSEVREESNSDQDGEARERRPPPCRKRRAAAVFGCLRCSPSGT